MPTFNITPAMDNDRALLINEYREGFMRTFAGQTVLMESFLGLDRIAHHQVTIPARDANGKWSAFNREFRGVHNDFLDWLFEDNSSAILNCDKVVVTSIVSPESIPPQRALRVYDHGNCIVSRIKPYYENVLKIQEAKPTPSRGTKAWSNLQRLRQRARANVKCCDEWLQDCYANNGMVVSRAQPFVDRLRILLQVYRPVLGINRSPMLVCDLVSATAHQKRHAFVNTNFEHAEMLSSFNAPLGPVKPKFLTGGILDVSDVTRLSMQELAQKHIDCPSFLYRLNKKGDVIELLGTHGRFLFDDPIRDRKKAFLKGGVNYCKLDWKREPELSAFIEAGTHHNGTIDGPLQISVIAHEPHSSAQARLAELIAERDTMQHIDMKTAYANYKILKYADGPRLMGKVTDFRETSHILPNIKGMYLAQLSFENANSHFMLWNEALKFPFKTNVVYTHFELNWLKQQGVTVSVTFGCWGSDVVVDFHARSMDDILNGFGPGMMEKSHDGPRNYAKWVGQCQSKVDATTYYADVDPNDFAIYSDGMRDEFSPKIHLYQVKDGKGLASVTYAYGGSPHLCHITAQILALIRLEMFEMCMTFHPRQMGRICSDGLYVDKDVVLKDHLGNLIGFKDSNDSPIFQRKAEHKFNNASSPCYASNMDEHVVPTYLFGNPLPHNMRELLTGPGGSGKTTWAGNQCYVPGVRGGYVRAVLLAHSIPLRDKLRIEFPGVSVSCNQNVFHDLPTKVESTRMKYNVLIFDEVSMFTREVQEKAYSRYGSGKIVFMGDIGYQAAPIPPPATPENPKREFQEFDQSEFIEGVNRRHFSHCYRFTDTLMAKMTNEFRRYIDEKLSPFEASNLLVASIPEARHLNLETFKSLYKQGDYLITRTTKMVTKFTGLLKDIERYKLKTKVGNLDRGAILYERPDFSEKLYELQHGVTVHAMQGTTVTPPAKMFICMGSLMEVRVLYTALSRARQLDQVYLVFHNNEDHGERIKRARLDELEVDLDTINPYDIMDPEPDDDCF
jgi:hypothetical protein